MNGRFEIELEGATYKGKFGAGAFNLLFAEDKISLDELSASMTKNPLVILYLSYHACKILSQIKGEDFTISKVEFVEILNDSPKQIDKVMTAFESSYFIGQSLANNIKDAKKQATKKKIG